jgi:4-hydroxy-3-methylbut-2-enyl diphosphate reductase
LVIRIHKIIHKLIDNGYQIIHFGDHHHDETKGVLGQAPEGRVTVVCSLAELRALMPNGRSYALTSQTTAGVAEFEMISLEAQKLFPGIEIFNTICDATSQRQAAVLDLAPEVDMMIIVGSTSSANSNRLQSICEAICGRAYLINAAADLDDVWLAEVSTVGITAGASTPDFLVEEVIQRLVEYSGGMAKTVRPEKKRSRLAALRDAPDAGH